MLREGGWFANHPYGGECCGRWGTLPSLRQAQGRLKPSPIEGDGEEGEIGARFFNAFRSVQNDVWMERRITPIQTFPHRGGRVKKGRGWVPASARTREGDHLHPFDKLRAGSNLPPSRGEAGQELDSGFRRNDGYAKVCIGEDKGVRR